MKEGIIKDNDEFGRYVQEKFMPADYLDFVQHEDQFIKLEFCYYKHTQHVEKEEDMNVTLKEYCIDKPCLDTTD